MKTKNKSLDKNILNKSIELPTRKPYDKYSNLEKRAARELYYQLGENRSLKTVFKILGIGESTLKEWSTADKWKEWAESRQTEDEKLALQGKYSTQILGLNAKAKAFLEEIIEQSAKKMNEGVFDVRASDAVNSAKLLLGLAEADKTPDILNTAVPIVIVIDKKDLAKELAKELNKQEEIPIVIDSNLVEEVNKK